MLSTVCTLCLISNLQHSELPSFSWCKMDAHQQLAEALGLALFSTDLYMPEYRAGEIGNWRITHSQFGMDHGYYSGTWAVHNMPVLLRNGGDDSPSWATWMSLSAHEIESQELGCRYAHGHTVVMGLGMGWVALNMALNPEVKSVTIVEYDPEVIDLFRQSGASGGLPSAILDKLKIVEASALTWQAEHEIDFLYADIWLRLDEPHTLGEVRQMQQNVQAHTVYYWGQEISIYAEAKQLPDFEDNLDEPLVRRCIDEVIALPLLLPPDIDYAAMIQNVIKNRKLRGLEPL
jgi:hypothetical protein